MNTIYKKKKMICCIDVNSRLSFPFEFHQFSFVYKNRRHHQCIFFLLFFFYVKFIFSRMCVLFFFLLFFLLFYLMCRTNIHRHPIIDLIRIKERICTFENKKGLKFYSFCLSFTHSPFVCIEKKNHRENFDSTIHSHTPKIIRCLLHFILY